MSNNQHFYKIMFKFTQVTNFFSVWFLFIKFSCNFLTQFSNFFNFSYFLTWLFLIFVSRLFRSRYFFKVWPTVDLDFLEQVNSNLSVVTDRQYGE